MLKICSLSLNLCYKHNFYWGVVNLHQFPSCFCLSSWKWAHNGDRGGGETSRMFSPINYGSRIERGNIEEHTESTNSPSPSVLLRYFFINATRVLSSQCLTWCPIGICFRKVALYLIGLNFRVIFCWAYCRFFDCCTNDSFTNPI